MPHAQGELSQGDPKLTFDLSFFWFVLPDKQLSVVLETVNIVFIASTGHVK